MIRVCVRSEVMEMTHSPSRLRILTLSVVSCGQREFQLGSIEVP